MFSFWERIIWKIFYKLLLRFICLFVCLYGSNLAIEISPTSRCAGDLKFSGVMYSRWQYTFPWKFLKKNIFFNLFCKKTTYDYLQIYTLYYIAIFLFIFMNKIQTLPNYQIIIIIIITSFYYVSFVCLSGCIKSCDRKFIHFPFT